MRKCVLLLLALLLALPAAALADDTQFIEHEPFALDDTWVDGSTRPGEYHYYPFTVEQVGLVTVRVQLFCGGPRAAARRRPHPSGTRATSTAAPARRRRRTLSITWSRGRTTSASATILRRATSASRASSSPAPAPKRATTTTYLGAQALPSGETLSGVLTQWDEHDFYTFTLDAETQVYLTANTTLESLMPNLMLYDGDMVKLSEKYGFKGYAEEIDAAGGHVLHRHMRKQGSLHPQGRLRARGGRVGLPLRHGNAGGLNGGRANGRGSGC